MKVRPSAPSKRRILALPVSRGSKLRKFTPILPSGWMTSGDQCVTQPQCLRRKGAQGAVALDVSAGAALGQDELDHRQAAQQAHRGAGTANSCGWGAARARVECRYSACRGDSYRATWQILVPAQTRV